MTWVAYDDSGTWVSSETAETYGIVNTMPRARILKTREGLFKASHLQPALRVDGSFTGSWENYYGRVGDFDTLEEAKQAVDAVAVLITLLPSG